MSEAIRSRLRRIKQTNERRPFSMREQEELREAVACLQAGEPIPVGTLPRAAEKARRLHEMIEQMRGYPVEDVADDA
jgi:hypothetical protein